MKTSVIFAVSIYNPDRVNVLKEFLDIFKDKYSDCDYYIGINYSSLPEVENIISGYNLNAQILRVKDEDLYCGSDASAYQAALYLMNNSKKVYDICWFAHTKGAVNNRPIERHMYLTELFSNRSQIEQLFNKYSQLGSYALRGVSRGAGGDIWSEFNNDHYIKICSNDLYDNLNYTHINWSYIETMYAVKGEVVQTFLRNAPSEFYTNKIQEPCYFEITFPWTVSRCGYFPYIKESRCFWGSADLKDITKQWIDENNLHHLNHYLLL